MLHVANTVFNGVHVSAAKVVKEIDWAFGHQVIKPCGYLFVCGCLIIYGDVLVDVDAHKPLCGALSAFLQHHHPHSEAVLVYPVSQLPN